MMNLEQTLLATFQELPPTEQQEVLDFANFLYQKIRRRSPLKSPRGLCADLKVDITEEDITKARQEMWKNFPREMV